jgi:hypothetical protein
MQPDPQYNPPQVPGGAPPPQDEGGYRGLHPCAAFFHVLFKAIAILIYIVGYKIGGMSYIFMFITVTLTLAADFWSTKNVTGRKLVALRWWNEIKPDGSNEWIFESGNDVGGVSAFDASFFWFTTYGFAIFWAVFTFLNILSPGQLPVCILGLVLAGSNALGYTKCRRDAKDKIGQFMLRQATRNPNLARQALASAV